MKYIKTYENLETTLLTKFANNIKKFGLEFFGEEKVECKVESFLYGKMIKFGEKNPRGDLMICFSIELQYDVFLNIKMSEHYIGVAYYNRSIEFKNYLISVFKSLSAIESNGFYSVKFDNIQELISKLNMEEYNFRKDANIYNL